MGSDNSFHLSTAAAEAYDTRKVPAIFGPMAGQTLARVEIAPEARVLDVACGTGVIARLVRDRVGPAGRVTGADLNPAMIAVARDRGPAGGLGIDYVVAPAEDMPFEDAAFDLLFCQQGIQFFPDKPAALREMRRVTAPGGRLVLTCWAGTPPFFQAIGAALERHMDKAAADKAVEPFAWNDAKMIAEMISAAGYDCPAPEPLTVERRIAFDKGAIRTELLATPNEAALLEAGEAVIGRIIDEVLAEVRRFEQDGQLRMPQTAHLFQAVAI
ncbi:class I SAM-dependent methyltransferase [Ruegeria marina]|uniref:Ubiquinone/menaquinone biosynthesis C-methylase UbiE n=1 Tax=Ruegeria marina TaxID=639004 RepID=A0A1G6SIC0_9RHOB|nr:methyltransferase domain-containing protein [Ruegeria marina]SDD15896.1 Ubiquinone/menaquinone biosynthesis C-methylase UbiE [Ruegeria marina]